ncbi:MAG: recombinase family protein [Oscillospiraceae bacterium]|nr:recombinase family protein [Oscillospiraceae bacterium]
MIRNIKYTGVMTNHTRESRFIRDKNQRRVPKDEWIIHPDAHEAIIPHDKWDKANDMLRNPKKGSKTVLAQPDRVYYCAHCGRKLRKTYGSDQYYSCASAKYQNDSECSGIRLKRSEMEVILVEALRAQVNFINQSRQAVKKEKASPSVECYRAIARADKELTQLQNKKLERYEAYRNGEISREGFLKIKEQITEQADELTAKKEQLERDYQALLQAKQNEAEAQAEFSQAEKVLTDYDVGLHEHLYDAIERVIVTTNEQIEIEWAFADIFAKKEV